uniref:Uncharacterized protein n=1 Tax=Cacopsylla melanoneura TaxID=428564 RepID=A0A8D8V9S7_9HEMI
MVVLSEVTHKPHTSVLSYLQTLTDNLYHILIPSDFLWGKFTQRRGYCHWDALPPNPRALLLCGHTARIGLNSPIIPAVSSIIKDKEVFNCVIMSQIIIIYPNYQSQILQLAGLEPPTSRLRVPHLTTELN